MRTPLFVMFLLAGLFLWQDNAFAQGENCGAAVTAVAGANVTPLFDGNGGASGISCTGQFSDLTTNLDGYWYTYTAAASGLHNINSCGTVDTRVNVLTGPCGGPYVCVGGNDDDCALSSNLDIVLNSGTQYWIVWDDRWGEGDDGFAWTLTAPAPPPPPAPGASCATAVAAVAGTNSTPDYLGNGGDPGTYCITYGPDFGVNPNGNAYWFSYTAAATGTHEITACNTGVDTRVSVYTGACGALACVGGNDDGLDAGGVDCPGFSSRVELNLTAGETYYIVWDDRWASADQPFDWDLLAPAPPPPAAIPTMGQWGMILFLLIMVALGSATAMSFSGKLAMANGSGSVSSRFLPLNKSTYPKVLIATYLGIAAVFGVAIAFFGYELTNADIPGSLLATPVLAYILHLFTAKK